MMLIMAGLVGKTVPIVYLLRNKTLPGSTYDDSSQRNRESTYVISPNGAISAAYNDSVIVPSTGEWATPLNSTHGAKHEVRISDVSNGGYVSKLPAFSFGQWLPLTTARRMYVQGSLYSQYGLTAQLFVEIRGAATQVVKASAYVTFE